MSLPVVLIHGLRGASTDWNVLRTGLENYGHNVVAPDLPGLGRRSAETFGIGESVATIADAVNGCSEPPLLVGLGVGAHLAIDYAALSGRPHSGIAGLAALGCGIRPLGWLLDSYRIASAANQMLPDKGAAISDRMADVFVRTESLPHTTDSFDEALRQLHVLETPAALARIDAPVWLINGRMDRFRMQERGFLKATRYGHLIRVPGRLAAGITDETSIATALDGVLRQLEHVV
jgi:pimeloyl-ACP methyl ester carboxylesterase